MPFLDDLTTMLGGWSDVKQINQEGFDFREKRRQAELARQQQQQQWEQENEDWAAKAAAEAALGGAPEEQIAGSIPFGPDVNRARALWRAKGLGLQAKSSLEDQRLYREAALQRMRGEQQVEQIGLRGDEAQDLENLRAKNRANMPLSPAEQARLQSLERRTAVMAAARREGVGGPAGRPQLRQVRDENGNTVWRWLSPGEEAMAPATAVERQATGMADTVKQNVSEMERLAPEVAQGRVAGNLSKAAQWLLGPHGKEGEFDFDANAVVDVVYIKSGKQINATEQAILRSMIPNRSKGNVPEQVRLFKDYANSLLQKYSTTGASGGQNERTYGGHTYRLKPGGNPKLKSSWEMIQ